MLPLLLIGAGIAVYFLTRKEGEIKVVSTETQLKNVVLQLLSKSVQAAQEQPDGTLKFPPVTFPMFFFIAERVFTKKFRDDIVTELHRMHPTILTRQTETASFPREIILTIERDKNNTRLVLTETPPLKKQTIKETIESLRPRIFV